MAEWYYSEDNQQRGPVADNALRALRAAGTVTDDTLVWRDGMTEWKPYREMMAGAAPVPATPQTPALPPLPAAALQGTRAGAPAIAPPTAGEATASLVLGILSLACFGFLTAIPGVICGHLAIKKINASNGALGGKGLATAGLVTGYVGIVISVLVILFYGLAIVAAISQSSQR
jgi:hypothetical protein